MSGLDLLLLLLYLTRTTPVRKKGKISKLATDLSFHTEGITNLLDFNKSYVYVYVKPRNSTFLFVAPFSFYIEILLV